jgi:hypothetical protein
MLMRDEKLAQLQTRFDRKAASWRTLKTAECCREGG